MKKIITGIFVIAFVIAGVSFDLPGISIASAIEVGRPTIDGPLFVGQTRVSGRVPENRASCAIYIYVNNVQSGTLVNPPAGNFECQLDNNMALQEGQVVFADFIVWNPESGRSNVIGNQHSDQLTVQQARITAPTLDGPLTAGQTVLRGRINETYQNCALRIYVNNTQSGSILNPPQGSFECTLDRNTALQPGQSVFAQLMVWIPSTNTPAGHGNSQTLTVQAAPPKPTDYSLKNAQQRLNRK